LASIFQFFDFLFDGAKFLASLLFSLSIFNYYANSRVACLSISALRSQNQNLKFMFALAQSLIDDDCAIWGAFAKRHYSFSIVTAINANKGIGMTEAASA
jgi:hypothetical protein